MTPAPAESRRPAAVKRLAPIALIAAILGAAVASDALGPLDNWVADGRAALASHPATGAVAVVDIDGRSLAEIGQWPWPRELHAALIDRLREAGAAEIAFDIDFSTTSNIDSDAALAAALDRAGGTVILAAFRQPGSGIGAEDIINRPIASFAALSWPGTVNVTTEGDGRVRTFPYGDHFGAEPILSIPAMLAGRAGDLSTAFRIDFAIDAATIDHIPAIEILNGSVDPARIAGHKIIVGASAIELRDLFAVPRYGLVSGATLQALAAETLIQDRVVGRVPMPALAGLAVVLVVLGALAFARRPLRQVWLAAIGAVVAFEATGLLAFAAWSLDLQTAALDVAVLAVAVARTLRELDFRRIAAAIFKADAANSRAVLDRVITDSTAGVIVCDDHGRIIAASASAAAILAIDPDLLTPGRACGEAIPAELAALLDQAANDLGRGDSLERELRVARGAKTVLLDVTITRSDLEAAGGHRSDRVALCVTFTDVTERRAIEKRNAYLARYDALTGLPNRSHFIQALNAAIEPELPQGAVLLFDLDRFKLVNDGLGHRCGDLLLAAAGARAVECIGDRGMVARLSGDEFAVLTTIADRGRLAALARALIASIAVPFDVEGYRIAVGATVGVSLLAGSQMRDGTQIMREADLALNAAKDQGGGHVRFFESGFADALDRRRHLEVALWDALARDEFEIAYQPQVDLKTGHLTGVEALARWRHPEQGWIAPSDFIPVAEATGLIEKIGSHILRRACREIASVSPTLKLAVNVSPLQFARGDVVKMVSDALEESGLLPSRLELEITESLFLSSGKLVAAKIAELKEIGVSFALDDFGTGYSSLNYLRKLPISKIKIDRSFVSGLPDAEEAAAIVCAVTAMGRALHIKVNAEGVETAMQAEILRSIGCSEGQGYLYGAATGLGQLRQRLTAGQTPSVRPRPSPPLAPAANDWRETLPLR